MFQRVERRAMADDKYHLWSIVANDVVEPGCHAPYDLLVALAAGEWRRDVGRSFGLNFEDGPPRQRLRSCRPGQRNLPWLAWIARAPSSFVVAGRRLYMIERLMG
jgi:hypothetical protein